MRPPGVAFVDAKMELLAPVIAELSDKVLEKDSLSQYCISVSRACQKTPLTDMQKKALADSIADIRGQKLTSAKLKANTNRLVANWHFIYEGMEVPFWDGSLTHSDAVFIGFHKAREIVNGVVWYTLRVKLKTGLPAGIINGVRLSRRQLEIFLDRVSGTRKYMCGVEEVAGMTANVAVERQGQYLQFVAWECSTEQRKANLEITVARGDVRKCDRVIPCNVCKRTITTCPLAVWLEEEK